MTLRTALWGNQTPFQLWSPGVVSEWVPCQRAASRKVGGGHTFLCWWFTVGVSWWTCCSVDTPGVGKLGASPCPPPRGPGLPSSPSAASLLAGRGGGCCHRSGVCVLGLDTRLPHALMGVSRSVGVSAGGWKGGTQTTPCHLQSVCSLKEFHLK